ncbi:MAG TPA: FKBP-type peptidyl-prolyl cis-trans isomerase [Ktedonobacteraceae bacterium]|jgi:FKBP-type peptidyl-prolyl cis-trans isomerase
MPQTVNGQNTPENASSPLQRVYRPGQRQQERMQRLLRRRKRQRIIAATIAAFLVIALGITGSILLQNYNEQQALLASQHTATATAHSQATARARANATATVVTQNCFTAQNAPAVPSVYTGSATPKAGPTTAPAVSGKPVTLKGGLKYVDIKVGNGPAARKGSNITVNYTGWLATTCQKFDSSYDSHPDQTGKSQPPQPFTLAIGTGQVIPGWDQGLIGARAGSIRRLYIPSALAYGPQGSGPIPGNTNLIFDVQIVAVK